MPGAADFVTAVLALPNLDCLLEMQDASGNPVDSSPNGFDITSTAGTLTYQVAGPDGGSDFGIAFSTGSAERSAPMNTNTSDWAFGCWVRWTANSVNQALAENGNPGSNGWGALLVAAAAVRTIAHGVAFGGTTAADFGDGLWQFFGLQRTAGGNWEAYFAGVADANNPLGTGSVNTPSTKFILNRNGADFEFAYVFSVSEALDAATWLSLYQAMVGGPPINVTPPVLSGAAVDGEILTTDDGSWSDADTFAYQWEDSPDGVGSWAAISGETADNYEVVTADIGNFLRCVVTATNGDGDTDEPSNVLGPVLPSLSGAVEVGAFSGDHSNGYSPTSYTPDTSGVLAGDYMIVTFLGAFTAGLGAITVPDGWVTLENDVVLGTARAAVFGKFTYEDAPTEVFGFPSAASFVGTLTSVRGGFNASDPITDYGKTTNNTLTNVAYETQDLVLGITLGSDASTPADILTIPSGFTDVIEEKVSAVVVAGWVTDSTKLEAGGSGNTSGLSFTYNVGADVYTLTILIEFNPGDVPEIVTDPIASGDVEVLGTVQTTDGTWTFSPSSFAYQWQESSNGISGWANIPGATSDDYVIDNAYSEEFVRCRVVATNGDGDSAPAFSNVLGPVDPYPTVATFTVVA